MVTSQEPLTTREAQVPSQVSQESQDNHQHNSGTEAPAADAGSISIASSDNRKVSREDIELVQNLIERCLQLYMNKGEVVRTLSNRARIEPGFTTLVWQKLEEENADFFRAYYIRLKLKKQIILFNHLLEHQYHLMKYPVQPKVPLAPMQNGIHPLPVNNLPMGYPVMQPPLMPATGQPHLDSMGLPNCHVVNGIPAPSSFHPMHMNSGNDIRMENGSSEATPIVPPSSAMSTMSEMAVSPASAASSNHFPFASSDMPGIGMDVSAMDTTFASDVVTTGGLQLGPDGGIGSSKDPDRSLGHLWNFTFPDLTADLTDLGDLGALGEYDGSPFLPSDSDILLDSPEHDDMVEEFFADTITNGPASDDEKT
ncbi:uncharacterized protein A4U43_C06F7690 [Asparagus officinalis]|uniref:Ectonucleotide pyrophosphatase/phosphodiesterase family member 3 n=1 Tax=Asparagus officinalis TaxID=4686 RepID=A0A5P1EK91_ASPOF|nr:uncharacterized protein LOC109844508 isoform X1 [Asparagus officinalis]ONK66415.1 uncharacterized protein A4U43_C06F7690 [Asparagus officinalis]